MPLCQVVNTSLLDNTLRLLHGMCVTTCFFALVHLMCLPLRLAILVPSSFYI